MTDTILPLTEADVRALGYTPFGYERDDRMGAVLAHKDGEAFYLCRHGAFWSIDPEYSNMRNALCEEPPNWRNFRDGCFYSFALFPDYGQENHDDLVDVLVWRVSDLPVERAERLGNYHTIAPVLAGLKAQAEVAGTRKADWPAGYEEAVIAAMPLQAPPAPRRPLKVNDRIMAPESGLPVLVERCMLVQSASGDVVRYLYAGGLWRKEADVGLVLPDAEG